jgi:hypothetical protein
MSYTGKSFASRVWVDTAVCEELAAVDERVVTESFGV